MLSIFSRIKEQPLEEIELRVMGGPLYSKLSTALNHARKTCPLDAYNKIENIEKTNGWVTCLYYRSLFEGEYIKTEQEKKLSKKNEKMNSYFDSSSQRFIPTHKKWVYHANEPEAKKMLLRWDPIGKQDPFSDPNFSSSRGHKTPLNYILFGAIKAKISRYTNCFGYACLIAKYLWEHHLGISRIEIVATTTFDHCIVIVNREGDLAHPDTWGDAWCIDGWYKDGIIFPAKEFNEQIIKIKEYAKDQSIKLKKMDIKTAPVDEAKEEVLAEAYDINPLIDKYPTYSTSPFHNVEDYYHIHLSDLNAELAGRFFAEKKLHAEKFEKCLESIRGDVSLPRRGKD